MPRRGFGLLLVLLSFGCGGSPSGSSPPPPEPPGFGVNVVVFYDQNGDGVLGPNELARIPDVEVTVGGRTGRTEKLSGRVVVGGVPAGTQTVSLRSDTIPPFFVPSSPRTITVPQGDGSVNALGLTLSIGNNTPDVYMAFGDSITAGDGPPPAANYPSRLASKLMAHFGDADVRNRGAEGTNSYEALERLQRNITFHAPAYTLILYGTNDWNDRVCQDDPHCYTVPNLRRLVREIKGYRSLPFLATLLPANPVLAPKERNDWITAVNQDLRVMAREEGAFVVDLHQAFMRQANLPTLFTDHIHPNAAGYELMAQSFFEAIAHGRSTLDAGVPDLSTSRRELFTSPTTAGAGTRPWGPGPGSPRRWAGPAARR
jgi:lysophospholipase L1-like esterase